MKKIFLFGLLLIYFLIPVISASAETDIYVDGTLHGKTGTIPQNKECSLSDSSLVVKVTLNRYRDYTVAVNTGPDQAIYGPVHVEATLIGLSAPTATKPGDNFHHQ